MKKHIHIRYEKQSDLSKDIQLIQKKHGIKAKAKAAKKAIQLTAEAIRKDQI